MIFGKFINRHVDAPANDIRVAQLVTPTGLEISVSGISAVEWLATPYLYPEHAALGSFLAQLFEEGYCERSGQVVSIPWASVYVLLDSEAYASSLHLLNLPERRSVRPSVSNKGSLTDADFAVTVGKWVDVDGAPLPSVKVDGACVSYGSERVLVDSSTWKLLNTVASFHQRDSCERTPDANRAWWGKIRKQATECRSALSDFLQKTIVLTPEKLHLDLRKAGEGEFKTIEVTPTFEDAPSRWMEMFDRLADVPDRYEIPNGNELVTVVIEPAVNTVLSEIKRMPGRRVSGSRAEAFVRNPFAVLGNDAEQVITPEDFEQSRDSAGLGFERFTPAVRRSSDGRIEAAVLLVESASGNGLRSDEVAFNEPTSLDRFVEKLAARIAADAQCCFWDGYEFEILGDTPAHLEQLRQALDEWCAPNVLSFAEVYDLSRYSERIEGIGEEKSYYSAFIARKTDDSGWFPDNVVFGIDLVAADGGRKTVPMDVARVEEFARVVQEAKEAGETKVVVPGCSDPIGIDEAERLVGVFLDALDKVKSGDGKLPPASGESPRKVERQHLIVKANIETLDYSEGGTARAEILAFDVNGPVRLPQSLRDSVSLREHQRIGLGWLQHLWRLSPRVCRGAVLADDMGLGKTIQLLSFIASCIESDDSMNPVLVVAPVALLENWKEEIDKFFVDGAMPVMTLYGESLAAKRMPKELLDADLKRQGITRLLKKDWLSGAKVVLTTYETLRDLEFALAAQPWSIMICDEAQKIKNPNAMVTRAAKKQNVRFRIACTGTPVENTLTDLWCLFDFVQPGLLGSLSSFGQAYRKPIEAETDEEKEKVEELREIIRPQLLRREKKDVARDLPQKLFDSECRGLAISEKQRSLYGQALSAFRKTSSGNGSAHLGLLMFLRRLCSDPMVEDQFAADRASVAEIVAVSPKMAWLIDVLGQIRTKDEKVIVFCEFRDLQRTLQRCIASRFDMHVDIINGDTSAAANHAQSRQKRIKAFQEKPGFGVIVLSPLAVGFGVNIQAANHVVHFTRTWNPAKEDQATDRAYRIGQERDVYVYYPVVVADDFVTFDQKLDQLLDWKRSLSSDMLNGTGELSINDFLDLKDEAGQPLAS